jgi:hypothetical protein
MNVECAPAFNYARNPHVTSIVDDDSIPFGIRQKKALFESADLTLDLRYIPEKLSDDIEMPVVHFTTLDLSAKGHKGLAVQAFIHLVEGQAVTFILRTPLNTRSTISAPHHHTINQQQRSTVDELGLSKLAQAAVIHAPAPADGDIIEQRQFKADIVADGNIQLAKRPEGRPLSDPYLTKVG